MGAEILYNLWKQYENSEVFNRLKIVNNLRAGSATVSGAAIGFANNAVHNMARTMLANLSERKQDDKRYAWWDNWIKERSALGSMSDRWRQTNRRRSIY